MDRREALKAAAAVGGAGLLGSAFATTLTDDTDRPGGASTHDPETGNRPTQSVTDREQSPTPPVATESPGSERIPHSESFERVVVARNYGITPEVTQTVNHLFEDHAEDTTLFAFDGGTYPIDYFELLDTDGLGVVGIGEEPATFVPAEGRCRGGRPWVSLKRVRDLVLENVTFDFREAESGGPLHLLLEGDSIVRDVRILGSCSNQIGVCKVEVRNRGGTARFERVVARNVGANQSLTGIFVRRGHAGTLVFEECSLETFSDNGLYASAPGLEDGQNGQVTVRGGTFRNNNIANVRLGTTGARVSDATVVVDAETPGWGAKNARGIRLRNRSGQVIENCEVTFGAEASDSFGGIVFHAQNGGATVRDTTITIDRSSIPAVRTFPVAESRAGVPTFEDCTIDGQAPDGVTARIEGRDGTTFERCSISGSGENRGGLAFVDSEDCLIADSRIDVGQRPVAVSGGTVTLEDTTIVGADTERVITDQVLENETLETV